MNHDRRELARALEGAGDRFPLADVAAGFVDRDNDFYVKWDEIARTSQAIGDVNTLPLELQGLTSTVTTPSIYALGTVTTVVSFAVMGLTVGALSIGYGVYLSGPLLLRLFG